MTLWVLIVFGSAVGSATALPNLDACVHSAEAVMLKAPDGVLNDVFCANAADIADRVWLLKDGKQVSWRG